MAGEDKTAPDLEEMLAQERRVWQALVSGDAAADRAALAPEFLGVYPSGFSGRDGHCGQLANGPTIHSYEIREARLQVYSADLVMLAYLACYTPVGAERSEAMYVSSLWQRGEDGWRNLFSQDTPAPTQGGTPA